MKLPWIIWIIALLGLLIVGCGEGPTPMPLPSPTSMATAVPTLEPTVTEKPLPDFVLNTAVPSTETPRPTVTYDYSFALPTLTPGHPTRTPPLQASDLVATIEARTADPFTAVAVSDNLAFLGYGSTLAVIDISNPSQSTLLGELPVPNRVKKIQVMDQGLFLVLDVPNSEETMISLLTVDISEPSNPVVLDSYLPDFLAVDATWIGEIAYIVGWPSHWEAINVVDPANMFKAKIIREVDQWDCHGGGSNTYAVKEVAGYLHVFQGWCRGSERYVEILDIADPFNPVQVGLLRVSYSSAAMDIAYIDNYAFTRIGGFLRVFDVSDWDNVGLLSDLVFPGTEVGNTNGRLMVVEGYIYVASTDGLLIVRQTERFKTEAVNQLYPAVYLSDIQQTGDIVYLTDWDNGLIILDAPDPANPVEVGRWRP